MTFGFGMAVCARARSYVRVWSVFVCLFFVLLRCSDIRFFIQFAVLISKMFDHLNEQQCKPLKSEHVVPLANVITSHQESTTC